MRWVGASIFLSFLFLPLLLLLLFNFILITLSMIIKKRSNTKGRWISLYPRHIVPYLFLRDFASFILFLFLYGCLGSRGDGDYTFREGRGQSGSALTCFITQSSAQRKAHACSSRGVWAGVFNLKRDRARDFLLSLTLCLALGLALAFLLLFLIGCM